VPTQSYVDVGVNYGAGFHPAIGRLQTYPTNLMVPNMPYLRILSPREIPESFRLNGNFFRGWSFLISVLKKIPFRAHLGVHLGAF
jgi:hypothetical protein